MQYNDSFGARTSLTTSPGDVEIYSLKKLDERVSGDTFSLPFSIRVILESLVRNCGGKFVSEEDVEALASWPESVGEELAYLPARVRSEERGVGKECRCRWSPQHYKQIDGRRVTSIRDC